MKKRFFIFLTLIICLSAGGWFAINKKKPPVPTPPPGANAYPFVEELFGNTLDLAEQRDRLHEIRNYSHYAYPGGTVLTAAAVPIFLNYQTSIKVLRVEAILLLFQGKREEALDLLADSVYLAHLVDHSNTAISRLIGVATVAISVTALQIYALNACETPEDCERLWPVLEELQRKIPPDSGEGLPTGLAAFLHRDTLREMLSRQHIADAKFQLVRMAAAARYHYLKQGQFPREAKDFAPFLPQGPPIDPFADAPLRFNADPATGGFNCYSIGPDEHDDGAAIDYDPSNGSYSVGDIVTRIPRQRQYPFPREVVHAASAKDLLAQFPKGLPLDPFADTKGRPLSVSDTHPVRVYSFGPDTNQAQADRAGAAYTVQEAYDPTNGIASEGDLFIEIKP